MIEEEYAQNSISYLIGLEKQKSAGLECSRGGLDHKTGLLKKKWNLRRVDHLISYASSGITKDVMSLSSGNPAITKFSKMPRYLSFSFDTPMTQKLKWKLTY